MATVNVRSFNGDDVIRVAPPAYFGGAYTWAFVGQRASGSNFHSVFSLGAPASPALVFSFSGDGRFQINSGGGFSSQDSYAWETTDLLLVVITRSGSGAVEDYHVFEDGVWSHLGEASTSTADPVDWTGEADDEIRFGNWNASFNWYEGTMVVQALWTGTDLSEGGTNNAAVEALAGGDRNDWIAAGADHLWEFTQADAATDVTDLVGDLDEIGIAGTAVTTLDLPATVYVIAAGGSPPVNTAAPTLFGTPAVGQNIICTGGTWDNDPTSFTRQWYVADAADAHLDYPAGEGTAYDEIAGETSATLTLAAGQADKYVFCAVTATNAAGSASEPSADIGPVVTPSGDFFERVAGEWAASVTKKARVGGAWV